MVIDIPKNIFLQYKLYDSVHYTINYSINKGHHQMPAIRYRTHQMKLQSPLSKNGYIF